MITFLIFIIGACIAGFIQGLTGFAFALVAMSFWVWVLPPQLSAPLVVIASLWCHIISLGKEQHHKLSFRIVLPYLLAGLFGVPLGTLILTIVNADLFKLILGIFLLVWCPTMFFIKKIHCLENLNYKFDVIIGFIGGILGGLGGFSGAIPSAWLMLKAIPKDQQRYILRHFNFGIQVFTLIAYLYKSNINSDHLSYIGLVLFFVSIPAILGAQLFYKISENSFKKIVLSLLFFSGCLLTLSSLSKF